MTVKFNIVERRNPGDLGAPNKYYPSIQSSGRKSLRQLSQCIADNSTVGRTDVLTVLDAMLYVIPQELADGNIVDLGDFGSFWLRTNSEGQENAEDVRPTHITNTLPRFTPGPEFKEALEKIKYAKTGSVSSETAVPPPSWNPVYPNRKDTSSARK